jgi:very-short-patch-repair endonuclease
VRIGTQKEEPQFAFRFTGFGAPCRGVELRKLEPFILVNHGLVTLAATRCAGISDASWYRACAIGQVEPLHRGVARVLGAPATPEQRIAAAVLAAGPGAMASHRSAARLSDIPRPDDDPVDIILPERSRRARLEGVFVHRPRDLLDLQPTRRHNIVTTKLLRWLCDLGAVDPTGVHPAVGHIVTNGIASPAALRWALDTHARKGRSGIAVLRAALDDWLFDGEALDSDLERKMKRLIKRYRLPPMRFHAIIDGYEVDFWVVDTPIVLECDGWEHHDKRRGKFERDRRRDAELIAAGYIVVHFTWTMLNRQPKWVVAKVNEAVARWAPHVAPSSGRQSSRIS